MPIIDLPPLLRPKYKRMFLINQHQQKGKPFIISITTTTPNQVVDLPLVNGQTYNGVVDYTDGGGEKSITAWNDANASNAYVTPGTYQIIMSGKYGGWSCNNTGTMKNVIISVDQWGDVGFDYLVGGFYGANGLTVLPIGDGIKSNSVTSIQHLFNNCRIVTISAGIFDKLPNITNAATVFNFNTTLTSVPAALFRYNPLLTIVQSAFSTCLAIANIGEDLFYYNTLITNYSSVFTNCHNIALPARMFNLASLGIVTIFNNFMNTASVSFSNTGAIQDVWNFALSATSVNAFRNQTALANYASIPNNWKGL